MKACEIRYRIWSEDLFSLSYMEYKCGNQFATSVVFCSWRAICGLMLNAILSNPLRSKPV